MAVTVDQILKLYVSGMLSGTGTQGDPIILDDLPPNTVIGDLGAGTGPITVEQLRVAMGALDSVLVDGVTITGDGVVTPLEAVGSGDVSLDPLNVIVATGSDTINLAQQPFPYWQIDLNGVSSETLAITNPIGTGVPLIHLHFVNMIGDVDVTFPSEMRDANGDPLGSHTFSQGQIVPFYYDGSGNYYTNYLTMGGGGGGNSIVQDTTGVPVSETAGDVTTLFSFEGLGGININRSGNVIQVINTAVPFESEYQAIIDQAGGSGYAMPSLSVQYAQNQIVSGLKAQNLWSRLKIGYMLTHDQALNQFSHLNWKDPSQFECTEVGPWTWTAEGVNGENVDHLAGDKIDTNWDYLADGGGNATLVGNYAWAYAVASPGNISGTLFGIIAGAPVSLNWRVGSSAMTSRYNHFLTNTNASPESYDIDYTSLSDTSVIVANNAGGSIKTFVDGSVSASGTSTQDADVDVNITFYLAGSNGIDQNPARMNGGYLRFFFMFDALSDAEAAQVDSIFSTYLNNL